MIKTAFCIRRRSGSYHRLLTHRNSRLTFDTADAAREFMRLNPELTSGCYVDQTTAFEWEKLITLAEVYFGEFGVEERCS